MMRKTIFLGWLFLMIVGAAHIDAGVRIGGESVADASAVLDLNPAGQAGAAGGFLLPRVRLASVTDSVFGVAPAQGLMVYNLNDSLNGGDSGQGIYWYSGGKWHLVASADSLGALKDRMASLEADSLVAVKSRISALERTVEQGNNLVFPQRQLDSIKIKKDSIPKGFMAYNLNGGSNDRPEEGIYWYGGEEWQLISDTSAWPVTFFVVSSYTDKTMRRGEALKVQVKANAPVNWNDVEYVWTLFRRDGTGETVTRTTGEPTLTLSADLYNDLKTTGVYNVSLAVSLKKQNRGAPFFVTTFNNY